MLPNGDQRITQPLEPVDLICGGFPCQDISVAGSGAGLSGKRSGLWFEYLRIVTHPKLLCRPWPLPEAWTFIEAVLAAPALTVLCTGPHHQSIIQQLTETLPDLRGEQMHETAIIATMIEHGIRRIVTRDIEYHRFPMIEVLDPLRTPA